MKATPRRRFFAPEVIQTSTIDCGPAVLKCVLEGFGIPVSYGRLREACQTDVDGTSIDVLQDVASQLGLEVEQTILPLDHLLLPESSAIPAIVIVQNPEGSSHFVALWRRHGSLVQVMDPGSGRRWMRASDLLSSVHLHGMPIEASAWRQWAGSKMFTDGLRARQRPLRVEAAAAKLLARAEQDPTWRSLSALDAATRMVTALVRARAIDPGEPAARLLAASFEQAVSDFECGKAVTVIPGGYFSAMPMAQQDGDEHVWVRGAVAVCISGVAPARREADFPAPLAPDLAAALREPPARPLRDLLRLLRKDGILSPTLLSFGAILASIGVLVEAIVLRAMLDIGRKLGTWEDRALGLVALVVFLVAMVGIELPVVSTALSMGRQLELRLRMAFLAKIPRLGDRYFHSRPTSDMTHRAHAIQGIRQLPQVGFSLVRSVFDLVITSAGIIWLSPRSAPFVVAAAATALAVPLAMQSILAERDLKVRAFQGALGRFYLDALLGLTAIRAHGAERPFRREHGTMLEAFREAFLRFLGTAVTVEAVEAAVGAALGVGLVFYSVVDRPASALLLLYWGLQLPMIGNDVAQWIRRYPAFRNMTLRLLEPIGAPEEGEQVEQLAASPSTSPASSGSAGVHLELAGVTVRAAGNKIIEEIQLEVTSGSHVAIVGASGAGKSSLLGLLLGWHRAADGAVYVDQRPLDGARLDRLRAETAWVDPTVQLWNRSLFDNVVYGAAQNDGALTGVVEAADVVSVLERLPDGLRSALGEGGGLISGGEGQRVRLARAMMRSDARLVLLDEPFRGLDRERRRHLLERARRLWQRATLLCVTHDVADTLGFPRVIVIEQGRIVEDGPPHELARAAGSRYRALLEAERIVTEGFWLGDVWRRWFVHNTHVEETLAKEVRP